MRRLYAYVTNKYAQELKSKVLYSNSLLSTTVRL